MCVCVCVCVCVCGCVGVLVKMKTMLQIMIKPTCLQTSIVARKKILHFKVGSMEYPVKYGQHK